MARTFHVLKSAVLVLFLVGAAIAQPAQLETARLVERDQRKEFNLTGDNSAFKFRFADAVSSLPLLISSSQGFTSPRQPIE